MNPVTPSGREVSPWLIAMVVSIATFMEVLDTTIVNVALRHIAGTMSASQDEGTWVLTSYLVANGIVLPLSGWLAGVIGRKRYFLLCIAGFTAASFACGAATSLGMLIVFRLMQGVCGGGLQPTQQSIVLDAFPPYQRGAAFAVTGITLIVAPIIGPTLGGWITDNFSWRWIFYINVPVGALACLLVSRLVQDPPYAKAKGVGTVDYIGLSLVVLALGCLQMVLDKGQQDDWFASPFITGLFAVSMASMVAGIFWMLSRKDPIVDLRLLKDRGFAIGCVLIFCVGFALYASSTLLPLLVQSEFGYDATLAGLVISPGGLMVMVMMPVSGKLVSRIQARFMIAVGLGLCSLGMGLTMYVTPQTDYNTFALVRVAQVGGMPFMFIACGMLAFMHIPKEKNNRASALYSLSRNIGGSMGIALTSTYLVRHEQLRQAYLSEHLSPLNPSYHTLLRGMTDKLAVQGINPQAAESSAMGTLYRELQHQAALLAYHDTFALLAVVMAVGAALALFLPKNDPQAKAAPEAVAAH